MGRLLKWLVGLSVGTVVAIGIEQFFGDVIRVSLAAAVATIGGLPQEFWLSGLRVFVNGVLILVGSVVASWNLFLIWGCLHFSDSDMAGWSGSAEVARVNRCLGAGGFLASIAAAVTIVSTAPSGPAALSSWDAVRVFFSGVGALVGGFCFTVLVMQVLDVRHVLLARRARRPRRSRGVRRQDQQRHGPRRGLGQELGASVSRVREGPAISVQVVVGVVLLVVLAAHVFILVVLGILELIDASGAAAITAMVVGMFLLHLNRPGFRGGSVTWNQPRSGRVSQGSARA